MDTLDKIIPKTEAEQRQAQRTIDAVADRVDKVVDDVTEAVEDTAQSINWRQVARYAVTGLAVAGAVGAYAYWRAQQRKPATRLERLKDQLGLSNVDFHDLKATLNRFDFEQLDKSRRKLGSFAKHATHNGAKKVADLTR